MSAKLYSVRLTALELSVTNAALNSALAGECTDGDLCWNETQIAAADRAATKLAQANPYAIVNDNAEEDDSY